MIRVEDDLARWEAGELSLAEVELRHPDADVSGLADLHWKLSSMLTEEDLDADLTWAAIRLRLPEGALPLRDRFMARKWTLRERLLLSRKWPMRLRRPLVAAVAAVFLLAGLAYAAGVDPVREQVHRVVDAVTGIFRGDPEPLPTEPPSPERNDVADIDDARRDEGDKDEDMETHERDDEGEDDEREAGEDDAEEREGDGGDDRDEPKGHNRDEPEHDESDDPEFEAAGEPDRDEPDGEPDEPEGDGGEDD